MANTEQYAYLIFLKIVSDSEWKLLNFYVGNNGNKEVVFTALRQNT